MLWPLLLGMMLGVVRPAVAGNPRWVSGTPYFNVGGKDIAWYTTAPLYFTDPGDLSAAVPHAAADQMVAAAAAVWNVPMSSLVLQQGGTLAEHVTGSMVSAGGLPADVQSSNWRNVQIAVLYDMDGSVLDSLMGAGASDPSGCLQNGVVESVDLFGQSATIEHALLILNGRCTGSAPELQLQMQYQLMRAFGRILGLGWSQLNDNVFTYSPVPTYAQAQHWPVMHPIDVVCGPYTYQCMPDPFVLRPDDLSTLTELYFIDRGQGASLPGKQDTLQGASEFRGVLYFPNGQGIEGMVITARRHPFPTAYVEPWQEVSSVTGYTYRRQIGTVVQGQDGSPMQSIGWFDAWREGFYQIQRVPDSTGYPIQLIQLATEAENPLYTGPYALSTAPTSATTISPSGSFFTESDETAQYYSYYKTYTVANAAASCHAGSDGTATQPVAEPSSGWWTGYLCGYNHSSWTNLTVQPNRTFTVEVTALDETGAASATKAMPMIGIWGAKDGQGQAPTIALNPIPFNSAVTGMSTVTVSQPAQTAMRMAFVDQRGLGRPDFGYQARVLYADSIAPANVSALGGTVVIRGTGFRSGMQVLVNGVAAQVSGVTQTAITAVVPNLTQVGGAPTVATVAVVDPTTGGSSTMLQALGYGAPGERLQLISAPGNGSVTGKVAGTAFAVRVLGNDGVTPNTGESVTLSVTSGTATLGACGSASCLVVTDANGVAQTTVTPTSLGVVGLKASTTLLSAEASFSAIAALDTIAVVSAPPKIGTLGLSTATPFAVRITAGDGVTPRAGQTVQISSLGGGAQLTACQATSCSLQTDATGEASTGVVPLTTGMVTLQAQAAAGTVQSSFQSAPETMSLQSAPAGLVTAGLLLPTAFAVKVVAGDGLTPVAGESVVFAATGAAVQFGACGAATCTLVTDPTGLATSAVTVGGVGSVTLSAVGRGGTATASLRAGLESMVLVTSPVGSFVEGAAAAPGMMVRVLGPDGATPVAGQTVSFAVTAGSALLGGCGAGVCSTTTDALGDASMTITPESVGGIVVTATGRTGSQTATLTGLPQPDVLQIVTGLPATAAAGVAITPVVLRLVTGGGGMPIAGQAVRFAITDGVAVLGVCGESVCTVVTDASGEVRTAVTPVLAGELTVAAEVEGVAAGVVLSATVAAAERVVVSLVPVRYVAEGEAVTWTAQVGVNDGTGVADGVPVVWTGVSGVAFGAGSSLVQAGIASAVAGVSGLGAGVQGVGAACAWGGVCGEVIAQGVSAAEWTVGVVSGAGQVVSLSEGRAAQPVVLRVTDRAGHPVLGAPVMLYQTVVAGQQPCPTTGRCTEGEVLGSGSVGLVSDASGLVSVVPMAVGTGASVTEVTAVAGTLGSATVSVVRQP